MENKKKVEIIMLQSVNENNLIKHISGNIRIAPQIWKANESELIIPQHLYLVSNDEIKEGDYCIDLKENIIWEKGNNSISNNYDYFIDNLDCKKVIASSDNSLQLPLIPQSFIKLYVEKQGDIKDAWIEMNISKSMNKVEFPDKPKLDSNNCVIITLEEEKLYTLEEVKSLCSMAFISGTLHDDLRDGMTVREDFQSWFKENIKSIL